jgi:integrase
MARRARGDGAVSFEHRTGSACKDSRFHRSCSGRWRGVVSLGNASTGKREVRKVSGRTKTEALAALEALQDELGQGTRTSSTYTVEEAVDDWLKDLAASGRAVKTVTTLREILTPLTNEIGSVLLRDLKAANLHKALVKLAETRSTRTIRDTRAALERAITFAQARDLVGRNVAALVKAPPGKAPGRPSRSLDLSQTQAVLKASEDAAIGPYVILSLLTGMRTEEARALLWSHIVAWDGTSETWLPVTDVGWDHDQFAVYVWRSVRAGGDTKTQKSRRTLALPLIVVTALRRHQEQQDKQRVAAAELWQENGLVFCSSLGTALDAHNVRRAFRAVCKTAKIGEDWTPRDLRHSFVSLMSSQGVPVEEIARLVGHTGGSGVTERIYRKELRPVITTGAEILDKILGA